jgi:hypothetical protein
MNNAAELWGLIKGLQLAIKNDFTKLIVEGDSQIIINLLRRILNGANPDRISPSWRLSHGLQIITDLLQPNLAVISPGWGVSGVHLAHDGGRLQPPGHGAM